MMTHLSIKNIGLLLLSTMLLLACETDFTNPGAASEDQVLNSANGLIGLAVGAQKRWSVGRQSPIYATVTAAGFTTGELRLINPGNEAENEMALGYNNVTGNTGIVNNIWTQALLTRNEAQKVIDNAEAIPNVSTRNAVVAYASIFHALANGTLAGFFEQVPLVTEENAKFSPASAALDEAIRVLENVRGTQNDPALEARMPGGADGIDIPNTIEALLARYYLQAGRYDEAIAAANNVDRTATSVFTYEDVNTNPIAFVSILTNNVYQPIDLTLGLPEELQPDTNDQRLAFYFTDLMPEGNDFRAAAFFDAIDDAIPVYVPGEMDLIIAEAAARSNDIPAAIAALNAVLTKQPADDPFGIGAALPAYSGPQTQEAVLDAIYTNRAMEMMMSGLRLVDSRRFGRPGPNDANPERNRNFYPYPFSERDNNPNTPPDPDI
ncbi:MAG: RagB/SusD family nutrient uptake outer membrane protein [Bacteroidetes bacterium]|nr:MAG: RagB/SusD family nutrient uptake outer membrane protein [Bacteroidota bacterium]